MTTALDVALEAAPRCVRLDAHVPVDVAAGAARSHLDDGRVAVWDPPLPPHVLRAVDAERRRRVPEHLVRAPVVEGAEDFWVAWTRLEVIAKLLDHPVVTLLRELPPHADLALRSFALGNVAVTVGVRRSHSVSSSTQAHLVSWRDTATSDSARE